MIDQVLCHRIGAPLVGHLSGETSHPLKREDAVNTDTPAVELTHEVIVKLVKEMENGIN